MPVILPPAKYDVPFPGRTIAENLSLWDINNDPRTANLRAQHQGSERTEAYSWTFPDPQNAGAKACHMLLPLTSDVGATMLAALKRHETAHCNGWPGDHPGGFYGSPNGQ